MDETTTENKPDTVKNSATYLRKEYFELYSHDHEEAHDREREAREESRQLIDARLGLLNELRADVTKDRTLYCTREYADMLKTNLEATTTVLREAFTKTIDVIRDSLDKNTEVIRQTAQDALGEARSNVKEVNSVRGLLNVLLVLAAGALLSGIGALALELVRQR